MPVFTHPPDSQFAYVVVAGKRARQLMSGAPALVLNPRSLKPTRIAMEELNASRLEYSVPESPADVAAAAAAEKDGKRRRD